VAVDRKRTLLGRRDLLSMTTLGGIGAAIIGGLVLGLRTLWPRTGKASALRLPAGRPEDYAVGQVYVGLLREHWTFVVRSAEGFYALSARCTHLGCKLRHVPAASQLHCACHGSLFSLEGEVLRGPASRHLERVNITLGSEGILLVDPTVRYRMERGEWSHPGSFVRYPKHRRG
jgi:cytochrome b6-f complex iron-sulfur subunit